MQRVVRLLAILFGVAALAVPAAMWLTGWTVILGAGGSEYHAIGQQDRPASYQLLTFGPWEKGAGPCTSSDILSLPPKAAIVEHRIGRARGITTNFTYYEAKYQMPDNSFRVTHASGPIPLISHRREALAASFFGCAILSVGMFLVLRWAQSRSRTTLLIESDTVHRNTNMIS